MSTKTTTTQTSQFNQPSMSTFNALQPMVGNALSGEIQNPFSNPFFQTQLQMGNQQLSQSGASAQQAMQQRMRALGQGGNSPLVAYQMLQLQRQNMAGRAGLFNNMLLSASQMRQQAIGQAQQYRPLQTGQTSVQSKSGLGTWLTPLVSAGIGGLTGGMFGSGGGGFFSGAGAGPTGTNSGPGMQDVSGGAFGEGPNAGMNPNLMLGSDPFSQMMQGQNSGPTSPWG